MAKRFITGERLGGIPGNTLNELADRVASLESQLRNVLQRQRARGRQPWLDCDAKNTDGGSADFAEREVVGIKTSAFDFVTLTDYTDVASGTTLKLPFVEVETYDKDKHGVERAAVTLAPIKNGKTGPIAFMGLVMLRLNQTDAAHKSVSPIDDTSTHVESGDSGWDTWSRGNEEEDGDDTLGPQWALAKLGGGSGGGIVNLGRAIALTTFDPAESLAVGDAGEGTFAFIAADGTHAAIGDPGQLDGLSEYFTSIPAGANGRVLHDGDNYWFITWGCVSG